MFENYLVNNRLWTKNSFSVEAYELEPYESEEDISTRSNTILNRCFVSYNNGDAMKILKLQNHKIYFTHSDKIYVYYCDVEIFCKQHCLTVDGVRNLKLDKLLT